MKNHTPPLYSSRRAGFIVGLLALVSLGANPDEVGSGCTANTRDQFPCGTLSDQGTALVCDGPNEVCACNVNRCIRPEDSETCPNGWRFVFSTEAGGAVECVENLETIQQGRDQNRATDDFCPGEGSVPPSCGVPGPEGAPMKCPSGSLCVCGDNVCIRQASGTTETTTCEDTGWVYTFDSRCVPQDVLERVPESLPDAATDLCQSFPTGVRPDACGTRTSMGAPVPCANAAEFCDCGTNRCWSTIGTSVCPTGVQWARPEFPSTEIDCLEPEEVGLASNESREQVLAHLESSRPGDVLCPDYEPPDFADDTTTTTTTTGEPPATTGEEG